MAIPLNDEQRALLRSGAVGVRTLIDFHLDSGRQSYWDGEANAEFEGQTYIAASEFGEVGPISMGKDLGAEGVEVKLNGTKLLEAAGGGDPAELFGTITTENYQMRRVDISFAFFDANYQLVLLVRRFAGYIDQIRQVEEVGNGKITSWLIVSLESIARRYLIRGGRTRSNDDQQEIWPGDTFFSRVAPTIAKQGTLYWGRKPPRTFLGGANVTGPKRISRHGPIDY